jgi:hypothetical protein
VINHNEIDRWIRYHSEISYALTMERTALESALIPVSAYILIACVECYRRYPEMIGEITGAVTPEELGRAGHDVTTQVDPVHVWAIPNFVLLGRKILMAAGLVDPDDDARRMGTVLDFWARTSGAYRFDDGTHQAADAAGTATPYRAYVDDIAAACEPVGAKSGVSRLNALLTSYLFLLWFDTRSGYQDTGPYALADGRVVLLRRYNGLGVSHFPWSAGVGAALPFTEVLGAFVLRDVELRVTDFGTSVTKPADYWAHVESCTFFDVAAGALTPIGPAGRDALGTAAKSAQKQLYRMIAGMERSAKIDAGAYVYFTFLRPFAELAHVALDWTTPSASLDLYPFLSLIDGSTTPPSGAPIDTPETYYAPLL